MGLFKNIFLGTIIGLIIAIIGLFFITYFSPFYYSETDGFLQSSQGGAITLVILVFGSSFYFSPENTKNTNFFVGLGTILLMGAAGWILPIFVWGPIALLSSSLVDSAYGLFGGFYMGGMSAGLVAGAYNHIADPFEQSS